MTAVGCNVSRNSFCLTMIVISSLSACWKYGVEGSTNYSLSSAHNDTINCWLLCLNLLLFGNTLTKALTWSSDQNSARLKIDFENKQNCFYNLNLGLSTILKVAALHENTTLISYEKPSITRTSRPPAKMYLWVIVVHDTHCENMACMSL